MNAPPGDAVREATVGRGSGRRKPTDSLCARSENPGALPNVPRVSRTAFANLARDLLCGGLSVFVLPKPEHGPTALLQPRCGVAVSLDVRLDLVAPPLRVRLRPSAMLRTAVPEATVHEYDETRADECEIGASSRAREWPVHTVSKSQSVEGGANGELAGGVSPWGALHAPADRCR